MEIKQNLIYVCEKAISSIEKNDILFLKQLSQYIQTNLAIYQNPITAELGIVLYSCSKIFEKFQDNPSQSDIIKNKLKSFLNDFLTSIKKDNKFENNTSTYSKKFSKFFDFLYEKDSEFGYYIKHVIDHAKLKEGYGMHTHGLSLQTVSNFLKISQWDLQKYVGAIEGVEEITRLTLPKRLELLEKELEKVKKGETVKIILDTGVVISFALNNLLWVFQKYKKLYGEENMNKILFLISPEVKKELVDKPLESKKYKLEALQVRRMIKMGIFTTIDNNEDVEDFSDDLLELSNSILMSKDSKLEPFQRGEIESLAIYKLLKANMIAIDERTLRYLLEEPAHLQKLMESRMNQTISTDKDQLNHFQDYIEKVNIIRSIELITFAFKKGFLDEFLMDNSKNEKKMLIDAILWGFKLRGASISDDDLLKLEKFLYKQIK